MQKIERLAGPHAVDLERAVRAVLAGGRAVMGRYAEDPKVQSGQWGGPVTEADRASHRAILEVLGGLSPPDRIVSEEDGDENSPGREITGEHRLWLVDPLDGTREFLARNGEFSIMVGLAVGRKAMVGAVYQPVPDRLFLGVVGMGAWVVENPASWGSVLALEVPDGKSAGPIRVVRSRSHGDQRLERLTELPGGIQWVVSGSVGIKCAMIALGEADLYVHPVPYLKEWDTCAPEAILAGAGGTVTDCLGKSLDYGKADPHQPGGIFASQPEVWGQVAPLVEELFQGEGSSAWHEEKGERSQ